MDPPGPVAVRSETPATAADAAELLRACADEGAPVRILGRGTKAGWGHHTRDAAVVLRTSALGALVEHNRGDLTAVVQAGLTLRELDRVLADAGQMLALDPPLGPRGDATVGGAMAAGDSGPLRHRYGAPRDLVLGVTVARPDGTVARAGGKVIKNVAGYDLAKLLCGSFGTLGLIAEVAVRLHPRPPAVATAMASTDDPAAGARAAAALAACSLEAQALDLRWEHGAATVLARFAGVAAAEQAQAAAQLLERCGLAAAVPADDGDLWERQRASQRSRPGGLVLRIAGRPDQLSAACVVAGELGATLVGRAALGVLWLTFAPADTSEHAGAVARVRAALAPSPCVVLDAPDAVRAALDPWDHPDDGALALMRRVKARFDPTGTCNPGLYVGGI